MQVELNRLVQALRDELQLYRSALARLERQQAAAPGQPDGSSGRFADEIRTQCAAIQRAQSLRRQASSDIAETLQIKGLDLIEELVPLLPADYQSLVIKLYRESSEQMERLALSLQLKSLWTKN